MIQKLTLPFVFIGILVAVMISGGALFTVDQAQQAIVLQFGELKKVHEEPGLKFKIPFIQEVMFYEKRVLDFDLPEVRITTGDQKRMLVDTYTRYRIKDPVTFFQTIKPANEMGAGIRLEAIISSTVRNVLGRNILRTLLSEERSKIMHQINEEVGRQVKPLGIEIVDVRIIRTELPQENRKAVFARMNSELERIAKENRAKGAEKAQQIRAIAERDRTILMAEAQKKAQEIRGEGESKALNIVSQAFEKDFDFYNFYRSMELYRTSMQSGTTLVLNTDSDLFKHFAHPDKK